MVSFNNENIIKNQKIKFVGVRFLLFECVATCWGDCGIILKGLKIRVLNYKS